MPSPCPCGSSLDYLFVRHTSDLNGRIASNNDPIGHIARDDGASPDQCVLSDRNPRTQNTATADPRRAQDPGRLPPEAQRGTTIADWLVIHGDNARAAEYFIFNNCAAREIT